MVSLSLVHVFIMVNYLGMALLNHDRLQNFCFAVRRTNDDVQWTIAKLSTNFVTEELLEIVGLIKAWKMCWFCSLIKKDFSNRNEAVHICVWCSSKQRKSKRASRSSVKINLRIVKMFLWKNFFEAIQTRRECFRM